MGAPSDSDPDRGPAPQADESIDDAWTTGSPAHNDRTRHGFYVEPQIPRSDGLPSASIGDHDRTTLGTGEGRIAPVAARSLGDHVGTGEERIVPATAEPVSIEQTISELETGSDVAKCSAVGGPITIFGDKRATSPPEEVRKLVQPERSPLEFVMHDEKPNAVPHAHGANDSSRFVLALIGDTPPAVESEVPMIPTMQPVLRRARLRRQRAALAAIVVVVAVVAIKLATSAPRAATAEVTKAAVVAPAPVAPAPVAPAPVAPAPVAPAPVAPPSNIAAESSGTSSVPVLEPAPTQKAADIASAKPTRETPAKSSTPKQSSKPKPKSTAMAKQPSASKKPTTAKKSTAKKSTSETAWTPKKRSF